ncbi:hypothetical protein FPS14_contig00005-0001 [Flavobacterium psychrophilum]|nr:hypothetical protein FPS14_contig00005-0001 [Flavobacterium psychrophilum]
MNLYLVNEPLNNIEFSTIKNEKFYIDIKGLFLTSKSKKK